MIELNIKNMSKVRMYLIWFSKQVQKDEGKVVCMCIRVTELIGNSIQEKVAAFSVQIHN